MTENPEPDKSAGPSGHPAAQKPRRRRRRRFAAGPPEFQRSRDEPARSTLPLGRHLSLSAVAIPFLAVMASAAFCYFARPILVPLVVALTLAYLLAPAVDVLTRKLPRPLSVLLVVAAAGLLLGALGFLLVDQGQSLARSAPEYWRLLKVRLGEPSTWPGQLPDPLASLLANILPDLQSQLGDIDWRAVTGSLFAGLGSLLGFLGWAVLVALLALFILLDLPRMRQQLVLAMGPNHQAAMNEALTDIDRQLRTFLAVKIGISGALGVVATVGLLTFGVPYAWVWGPLVGILNIIPYLGALISSVPPVVMVALDQQSLWPGLWVAAFLILLQQLEGNFITPKVMGDRIQLNVVAVLLASMIWGWLWGAMGVLLAIPITAALKVVCERIEPLRPIAVLLG